MLEFPFLCSSPPAPCISAFKSQKTHVKKDGSVSINSKDTSKDSAAAALVALLSPSEAPLGPRGQAVGADPSPPKTTT